MWIAEQWQDYELLDCGGGEKLERWGEQYLVRPDPQAIWDSPRKNPAWKRANARYLRSQSGGGHWETIHVPKYEFARQMRSDILSQPLKLGPDELAIFEGIHALNDVIVGKNPKAFKLYIAARSNVVDEDGAVVFQHPWLRLCLRIVRDYKFRGSDANFTLKMWPNVRRGEKLYISPYKENADLMFDSSLPDEVAVLKPFVVPLLEALPQGKYEIADDILRGFERIEIMEESNIAPSSLVREFIGGSIYPS